MNYIGEYFDVTPTEGRAPLIVIITNKGYMQGGTDLIFFGDGRAADITAEQTHEHTYQKAGLFTIDYQWRGSEGALAARELVSVKVSGSEPVPVVEPWYVRVLKWILSIFGRKA